MPSGVQAGVSACASDPVVNLDKVARAMSYSQILRSPALAALLMATAGMLTATTIEGV